MIDLAHATPAVEAHVAETVDGPSAHVAVHELDGHALVLDAPVLTDVHLTSAS
jgi:hypothetical protein